MNDLPLCVDLDGTLLKTDTLYELLVRVLKQQPWLLFVLFFWLWRGKHILKCELSKRCQLNAATLPYNPEFVDFLRAEYQSGRKLLLVTGACRDVAESIASHYGFFSGVLATDEKQNLTGKSKSALLVQQFGDKGFDYAGNDAVDVPVWEKSRTAYLVNVEPTIAKRLVSRIQFAAVMDMQGTSLWRSLFKAMRLHQWAKNALIFLPLMMSHQIVDVEKFLSIVLAFLAFGCCASFSYIINDMGDLDADRMHHSKNKRPFASAELSIASGILLALFLLAITAGLSFLLPAGFVVCLLAYFVITNAYTLRLKYVPILDVAILAGLYTLRVIAGGLAVGIPMSFWLLAFSCFIFFSLAIVKRVSELLGIETPDEKVAMCRGYWTSDIPVLNGLGTASALMAVLVSALYINSPDVIQLYSSPRYLWLLCPIIALWLGRVWLITGRGQMHDDPVVFALRDRVSWLLFVIAGMCLVIGAQF